MNKPKVIQSCSHQISEGAEGGITIHLEGGIGISNAAHMTRVLYQVLENKPQTSVTVDLNKVNYLDDFGVLVLAELKMMVLGGKGEFYLQNISNEAGQAISMYKFDLIGKRDKPYKRTERQD